MWLMKTQIYSVQDHYTFFEETTVNFVGELSKPALQTDLHADPDRCIKSEKLIVRSKIMATKTGSKSLPPTPFLLEND